MGEDGRDVFAARLRQELAAWRSENLVSETQAQAILARYDLSEAEERRSRVAVLLAFLGALLVGIGVIVFFAANWENVPRPAKLLLIFAAVVAAYHGGYWLRYRRQVFRGTGSGLLFLGVLLYGAAIFLIAQGFHVNANAPSLLVLWAAGTLPMAYLLGSQAMVVLMLLNLAVALGWETTFWLQDESQLYPFVAVYLLFGVLLYALGSLQERFESTRRYRLPYGAVGLLLIMGALFPPTFAEFGDSYGTAPPLPPGGWVRISLLAAAAVGAVLANLLVRRRPCRRTLPETAALAGLLALGIVLSFHRGEVGAAAAVCFNLLLLAVTVGVIVLGCWDREPAWVNLGVAFFALLVIVRYFDWFWDLLPRALFFIGAGALLLLGGAALERTRRQVVERLIVAAEAGPGDDPGGGTAGAPGE